MTIRLTNVFLFLIFYFLLFGIWQFIWLWLHSKGYEINKENNESFYDFMCRYYKDSVIWKIRKKLNIRWFYNSRAFKNFIRLKGIVFIIFSLAIFILFLYLKSTDYGFLLEIPL